MEITNFIIHSSTCYVRFEYLNKLLLSFAYDFILNGRGLDNDFPNSESSTAGGLRTENLVPTLVVVSQPVRMRIAESTIHTSCLIQRDCVDSSTNNSERSFFLRSVLTENLLQTYMVSLQLVTGTSTVCRQ